MKVAQGRDSISPVELHSGIVGYQKKGAGGNSLPETRPVRVECCSPGERFQESICNLSPSRKELMSS